MFNVFYTLFYFLFISISVQSLLYELVAIFIVVAIFLYTSKHLEKKKVVQGWCMCVKANYQRNCKEYKNLKAHSCFILLQRIKIFLFLLKYSVSSVCNLLKFIGKVDTRKQVLNSFHLSMGSYLIERKMCIFERKLCIFDGQNNKYFIGLECAVHS